MRLRKKFILPAEPGIEISNQLTRRRMSLKDFADSMGMTSAQAQALIEGNAVLSPDIAEKLESIRTVPADFWLYLESVYREDLALLQKQEEEAARRRERFAFWHRFGVRSKGNLPPA